MIFVEKEKGEHFSRTEVAPGRKKLDVSCPQLLWSQHTNSTSSTPTMVTRKTQSFTPTLMTKNEKKPNFSTTKKLHVSWPGSSCAHQQLDFIRINTDDKIKRTPRMNNDNNVIKTVTQPP